MRSNVSVLFLMLFTIKLSNICSANVPIENPGFENGLDGWKSSKPSTNSSGYFRGSSSGKIHGAGGRLDQQIALEKNTDYRLMVYLKGSGEAGINLGFDTKSAKLTSSSWKRLIVEFNSGSATTGEIFAKYYKDTGRFDNFTLKNLSVSSDAAKLDPNKPPSENFDLDDWYLSIPVDEDGNGFADTFKGASFEGYENKNYFYTGSDGGMVFKCPVKGYTTSKNTSFVRVELREMLSRGASNNSKKPENNWVFSSTPKSFQEGMGGVDGVLRATLAVNHVTKTGKPHELGRVVIGQIHAVKDEPLRLYYRKAPGNTKGTIYLVHEPERKTGLEEVFEVFYGNNYTNGMRNPENGIALNEKFTYEVRVKQDLLSVTIIRDGHTPLTKTVNMKNSGYDKIGQYMYFKAGVYNQNKTGDADDYVQATFYELTNSHDGYLDF